VAAFDIRFDGHAVLSCELKDEAMAHELHREAKNQELDVWSHSTKVVSNRVRVRLEPLSVLCG